MKHKSISPKDLVKRLRKGDCTLVDIREPDEHAQESIPGAENIPLSDLSGCACPDSKTLVFHCKSGKRTEMAADKLADWAGRDVLILKGGIEAWRKAGEPTQGKN